MPACIFYFARALFSRVIGCGGSGRTPGTLLHRRVAPDWPGNFSPRSHDCREGVAEGCGWGSGQPDGGAWLAGYKGPTVRSTRGPWRLCTDSSPVFSGWIRCTIFQARVITFARQAPLYLSGG